MKKICTENCKERNRHSKYINKQTEDYGKRRNERRNKMHTPQFLQYNLTVKHWHSMVLRHFFSRIFNNFKLYIVCVCVCVWTTALCCFFLLFFIRCKQLQKDHHTNSKRIASTAHMPFIICQRK